MTLQEKIYQDILSTDTNKEERDILKLVKADIQRERNKEVPDNIVIKILKSHISGATECMKYLSIEDVDRYNNCVLCIKTLEEYLPRMVSDEEIKQYITDNIGFYEFNNVMQAMKPIMKHFGSTANGNDVKRILMKTNRG